MRHVLLALPILISLTTAAASDECYRRVYTEAHIAKHPDQLVTSMLLKLHEDKRLTPPQGWGMRVEKRGRSEKLYSAGLCSRVKNGGARQLDCFVECDGGSFKIKYISRDAIYLYLGGIRMFPTCDLEEENSEDLLPGKDDKIFKLYKVPASACRGMDR